MKSPLIVVVTVILAQLLCRSPHVTATGCDDVLSHTDCTCRQFRTDLRINCSGLGLLAIPQNLPTQQRFSIDFSKNLLAPKSINKLCKYELHKVSLANNHISQLPGNQFNECRVIEELDLNGNQFEQLTADSLTGLDALNKLVGIESRSFEPRMFSSLTSLSHLNIVIQQWEIPADLFSASLAPGVPGLSLEHLELVLHGALNLPTSLLSPVAGSLHTLAITSSSLQWLEADQLASLHQLRNFELTSRSGSLRQIPYNLFSGNHNLDSISLSGMASIPRHMFTNLDNLESLQLQGVEDMPSELFEGLLHLQSLEVTRCTMSNIPDGWLQDLYDLEYLVLTENGLSELSQDDFKNLRSLVNLDLSGNVIRELKNGVVTEVAKTIEGVDLSNNDIQVIHAGNFAEAERLTMLDLSGNMIHTLKPGAFTDLHNLILLNLTSNKLTTVEADLFATNNGITELYMADNILASIPDGLFKHMNKLRTLDLSRNNLHNLGPYSHYPSRTLSVLDFSYNAITCDCEFYDFIQTLSYRHLYGDCYKPDSSAVLISDFGLASSCHETTTTSLLTGKNINSTSGINITTKVISHPVSSKENNKSAPLPIRRVVNQLVLDNQTIIAESSVNSDIAKTIDEPTKSTNGLSSDKNKSDHSITNNNPAVLGKAINVPSEITTPGNGTGDSGEVIIYDRVTEGTHRMAIIFIVGVTVVCALVIGLLCWKRRRRSRYEVERAVSALPEEVPLEGTESKPLHGVPSITIEKVDAMDNVKVELYEP